VTGRGTLFWLNLYELVMNVLRILEKKEADKIREGKDGER
jgi:hypothetical protein